MDREEFEKNWHQLKGKIQEKWNRFTHDELNKCSGKLEHFLGSLQKKYGFSRTQAELEVKNWHVGHGQASVEHVGFWKKEGGSTEEKQSKHHGEERGHKDKKRKAG